MNNVFINCCNTVIIHNVKNNVALFFQSSLSFHRRIFLCTFHETFFSVVNDVPCL